MEGTMTPLENIDISKVNLGEAFKGNVTHRIRGMAGGSSFFHALLRAYFKPYVTGKIGDETFNRSKFVRSLRKELSRNLEGSPMLETIRSGNEDKGEAYQVKNLVKVLASYETPFWTLFLPYISHVLKKHIYIVDSQSFNITKSKQITSDDTTDWGTVILLHFSEKDHYETIGIENDKGEICTHFSPSFQVFKFL